MAKFRVLAGAHDQAKCTYTKGETFESELDLAGWDARKFERVADETPVTPKAPRTPESVVARIGKAVPRAGGTVSGDQGKQPPGPNQPALQTTGVPQKAKA